MSALSRPSAASSARGGPSAEPGLSVLRGEMGLVPSPRSHFFPERVLFFQQRDACSRCDLCGILILPLGSVSTELRKGRGMRGRRRRQPRSPRGAPGCRAVTPLPCAPPSPPGHPRGRSASRSPEHGGGELLHTTSGHETSLHHTSHPFTEGLGDIPSLETQRHICAQPLITGPPAGGESSLKKDAFQSCLSSAQDLKKE